jgi:hypothetical protein
VAGSKPTADRRKTDLLNTGYWILFTDHGPLTIVQSKNARDQLNITVHLVTLITIAGGNLAVQYD